MAAFLSGIGGKLHINYGRGARVYCLLQCLGKFVGSSKGAHPNGYAPKN